MNEILIELFAWVINKGVLLVIMCINSYSLFVVISLSRKLLKSYMDDVEANKRLIDSLIREEQETKMAVIK